MPSTDPLRTTTTDPTRRVFWLFIALHVLVWTVVPALTQPNRPLDMVEMLFWGQAWQWGYSKHPPLPAWIAQGVFELTAGAAWPLYLVAQLGVATSLWAAWKLAREYLRPWPALCAALLLEACSYYNFMTTDLNNAIVLVPLWALACLFLYWALTSEKLRYWTATGVCIGLGMLTKYDTATLVIAMLALPVINRDARARLRSFGPYLTLAVSLAIFMPHVAWMIDRDFITLRYAHERAGHAQSWLAHMTHPLEFLLAQAIALAPPLAVAWPLWRGRAQRGAESIDSTRLKRDFLLVICCGPCLFDVTLSVLSGLKPQSMWGAPMWTFSSLALLCLARTSADADLCFRVVRRCGLVGSLLALAVVGKNVLLPYLSHRPGRVHFPGPQLAAAVDARWRETTTQPLQVVTGSWWAAASASLHMPHPVQLYDFFQPGCTPWAGDDSLESQGGVILCDAASEIDFDREVARRFPEALVLPPIELRWQTLAPLPPARFGIAIVLPKSTTSLAARGSARK